MMPDQPNSPLNPSNDAEAPQQSDPAASPAVKPWTPGDAQPADASSGAPQASVQPPAGQPFETSSAQSAPSQPAGPGSIPGAEPPAAAPEPNPPAVTMQPTIPAEDAMQPMPASGASAANTKATSKGMMLTLVLVALLLAGLGAYLLFR